MLKIKEYVKVKDLEEAYLLNQKKNRLRTWWYGLAENGKTAISVQPLTCPDWTWI